MKLVRFELVNAGGGLRSGLMYDERIYETDGDKAIGIHELGTVRLHSPVGVVPAVRVFEALRGSDGSDVTTYRYLHAHNLQGPLGEVEMPQESDGLDFDVHIAAIMQDSGTQIGSDEAGSFVLGYSILIAFNEPHIVRQELANGLAPTVGTDVGAVLGPFLVTPEDVAEFALSGERLAFAFPYDIKINGESVATGVYETMPGLEQLLAIATRTGRVFAAEVIAWPKIAKPDLDESTFGRFLLPTDRVVVEIESLGTLVARVG